MFTKKNSYLIMASCFLVLLLFFHNQIAEFLLSIVHGFNVVESGEITAETRLHYRNGVVVISAGIIFFCLVCWLENNLLEKGLRNKSTLRYCYLGLRIVRWAAVIIVGDAAIQCFDESLLKINDYSIQYQAVGALIAIELTIIVRHFGAIRNKHRT